MLVAVAGCAGGPKPDKYCPGVLAALPHHAPATIEVAINQINELKAVVPPGNDKPVDNRVMNLVVAIGRVGETQGILGGGAAPDKIAAFYAALRNVRSYCKARS